MLTAADLLLINTAAARRFAGIDRPEVGDARLATAVAAQDGVPSIFARTASLAAALLRENVFSAAPLHTALLAMHCALSLDGMVLLAPQGVVAGMMKGLAAGDDPASLARWLEDRAVPSTGGG